MTPAEELTAAALILRAARSTGATTPADLRAALLRAREPLATLLDQHAAFVALFDQLWQAEHGTAPTESDYTAENRAALATARAILGTAP